MLQVITVRGTFVPETATTDHRSHIDVDVSHGDKIYSLNLVTPAMIIDAFAAAPHPQFVTGGNLIVMRCRKLSRLNAALADLGREPDEFPQTFVPGMVPMRLFTSEQFDVQTPLDRDAVSVDDEDEANGWAMANLSRDGHARRLTFVTLSDLITTIGAGIDGPNGGYYAAPGLVIIGRFRHSTSAMYRLTSHRDLFPAYSNAVGAFYDIPG